ncbi:hypothetical protein DSM14862_04103 (plasmid) [Sulfitobacter indolifex]|uniref:Mobilization protein n=1 Tax=Sulfitobacter indolifex HEL-45 TaxID=391624 RepID=A0ABM9X1V3_9RHOB|nr:hypothetical protein [Sulfitobacter indolifex]EDQ03450.1 hypothetical protein OIHEL45_16786 [Sulfitobacter indolifex HEL-45]UOA21263.1 hypothetical protein DSM14862_04103 [Sulfitobacter indolifex]
MAKTTNAKRHERVKVNVTSAEKAELVRRAEAAGQSLSDHLRHVGLGRRSGASPEQVLQLAGLLEQVLEMLQRLAGRFEGEDVEAMLLLVQLQRIERVVLMLAPVGFSVRSNPC